MARSCALLTSWTIGLYIIILYLVCKSILSRLFVFLIFRICSCWYYDQYEVILWNFIVLTVNKYDAKYFGISQKCIQGCEIICPHAHSLKQSRLRFEPNGRALRNHLSLKFWVTQFKYANDDLESQSTNRIRQSYLISENKSDRLRLGFVK